MFLQRAFYDRKISDVLQITGISGGLIQIEFCKILCFKSSFSTFSILFVFSTLKADLDKEVYVIRMIK